MFSLHILVHYFLEYNVIYVHFLLSFLINLHEICTSNYMLVSLDRHWNRRLIYNISASYEGSPVCSYYYSDFIGNEKHVYL